MKYGHIWDDQDQIDIVDCDIDSVRRRLRWRIVMHIDYDKNWKYRSSGIVVAVVELICSSHSLVLLQVEDEQVVEEQISINWSLWLLLLVNYSFTAPGLELWMQAS